jgi:hypothetical protein
LFIAVAVAVTGGAILAEIAIEDHASVYYQVGIWIGAFALTFGAIMPRFRKAIPSIKARMKHSMSWSTKTKAINGLCWAAPFATIGAVPQLYQYLILLGIGLGNLSTYVFLKKYSGLNNLEQLLVGAISLAELPIAAFVDLSLFSTRQDLALMISRLMIAAAYAAGAAFALGQKGSSDPRILERS